VFYVVVDMCIASIYSIMYKYLLYPSSDRAVTPAPSDEVKQVCHEHRKSTKVQMLSNNTIWEWNRN